MRGRRKGGMIVSSFNTSSPILSVGRSVVHLFCLFTLPLNSMLIQYSGVGSRVAGCKALSLALCSPLEIKITHARFPPPSTCRLLVVGACHCSTNVTDPACILPPTNQRTRAGCIAVRGSESPMRGKPELEMCTMTRSAKRPGCFA